MTGIVDVSQLVKTYGDGTKAVKGISFNVSEGEFFGFLGPNGAGKTTTLKILLRPLRGFTDRGAASGKLTGVETHPQIPQALHRAGRLLQAFLGEIELTPVRDGGKQKTYGRWLVSFFQQIAQRIKIPE